MAMQLSNISAMMQMQNNDFSNAMTIERGGQSCLPAFGGGDLTSFAAEEQEMQREISGLLGALNGGGRIGAPCQGGLSGGFPSSGFCRPAFHHVSCGRYGGNPMNPSWTWRGRAGGPPPCAPPPCGPPSCGPRECGPPEGGSWGPNWQCGTQVQVAGDPHNYQNGQLVSNWADTGSTEQVFLDGKNEVDVTANQANTQATGVRVGQDLAGISPDAQVQEMVNGQLTDVGTAAQNGLVTNWGNAGVQLAAGQTVNTPNGQSVNWDGNGTVTMTQN